MALGYGYGYGYGGYGGYGWDCPALVAQEGA